MKQTCAELLQKFENANLDIQGEKITFSGVGNRDVYNITAPFMDEGEWVIAGRVEGRDTEHSVVKFFVEREGVWVPRPNAPTFTLQDPFVTWIHGELIFGGVEIYPHPTIVGALGWRTNFYRGSNIQELKQFTSGPDGMKDIRLVEMVEGQIGVFTRPQGEVGGRGKIGFTVVDTLTDVTPAVIEKAQLLDQFIDEEWGGANEVHLLKNGLLGVLGHIACFGEQEERHYYPMVFCFNPSTFQASPMELIATRSNFPPGDAKRPDLVEVIFSGGLHRLSNGQAQFYAGVSDAEAHRILIPDPFLKYEENMEENE